MSVTTEDTKVTASLKGARLLGFSACFGSVFVLKNREHLDGSPYRKQPPPQASFDWLFMDGDRTNED